MAEYSNALGKALGNRFRKGNASRHTEKISSFLFEIEFEAQKVTEKLPSKGTNISNLPRTL